MPICKACGQEGPPADKYSDTPLLAGGWALPINRLGYYNGFDDDLEDEVEWVEICHDCVLRVLDVLPGLKSILHQMSPGGLHPSDASAPPCCDYAWSVTRGAGADDHVQLRAEHGKWVVHVKIIHGKLEIV
jgi:hypothetical protein